jgi:hypothetical protein
MTLEHQYLAAVFDEWAKRYAENPDEFGSILDDDGKPVEDYGLRCAIYFDQLVSELFSIKINPLQTY